MQENTEQRTENGGDEAKRQASSIKRKKKKAKKKKIPFRKILGVTAAVFLLTYVSVLVYTSNLTMIETEEAEYYEVNDYIEVEAFAVRNEEYVESKKDGILAYTLDDGDNVNVGGTVAKLFSNEADVKSWQEYNKKEDEINILKQLSNAENNMFVDLDTVDSQIKSGITSFKAALLRNSFDSARNAKLDLLQLFNERAVITGGAADFSDKISKLEGELSSLDVSSIGDVKSQKSGVFVAKTDGYEKSVDYKQVLNLTAADMENLVHKDAPADAVGKVITTLNWYFVCPVTSEQALTVATGDSNVEISIPKVISGTIPGTVEIINQTSKTESGLLIIKCDYMDGDLAGMRKENISIRTKTYSGLKIDRKAIHEDYVTVPDYDENGNETGTTHKEKVQGVYIMYGRKLNFIPVNIIYSSKEFVICDPDTTSSALPTGETIALHDEVVIQGKDLYDGKIIK